MRIGKTIQTILLYMNARPETEVFGGEITRETGVGSAHLYPALKRLLKEEMLSGRLEDIDPSIVARPVRKYYLLTQEGRLLAHKEAERLKELQKTK